MHGLDIMSGAREPKMIGDESLFSRAPSLEDGRWLSKPILQKWSGKDPKGDIFGEPCRHRVGCVFRGIVRSIAKRFRSSNVRLWVK